MIDAFAINGKRHRRNFKDIYVIVKLSHDLTTLKMFPSVKSHFFLSNYPRKSKAYQKRKKYHKLSKCHAREIHKRVTVLCMQSQDCKRLLGGCQHSLPDGILVITLVLKVSSLSSLWSSYCHYFVITLILILPSLSSL